MKKHSGIIILLLTSFLFSCCF